MEVTFELEFLKCPTHKSELASYTRYTLTAIMAKHFVNLVNRKLSRRDLRPNAVVDDFLKTFGPKF
jgi:SMC interacting uncharacterized protein involved in chromosome segregation